MMFDITLGLTPARAARASREVRWKQLASSCTPSKVTSSTCHPLFDGIDGHAFTHTFDMSFFSRAGALSFSAWPAGSWLLSP
jgi:hypothetical protein